MVRIWTVWERTDHSRVKWKTRCIHLLLEGAELVTLTTVEGQVDPHTGHYLKLEPLALGGSLGLVEGNSKILVGLSVCHGIKSY